MKTNNVERKEIGLAVVGTGTIGKIRAALASEKPQWAGYRPEGFKPDDEHHVEFLTSFPPGDVAYGQIWGTIREESRYISYFY
jgi:hypothetical protein